MKREAWVESYLVLRVKETGGTVRKVVFPGRRGAPDRLCGWKRTKRNGLVETKKPEKGVLEAHQAREHERLRAIGLDVRVIWTREQVDEYVENMSR